MKDGSIDLLAVEVKMGKIGIYNLPILTCTANNSLPSFITESLATEQLPKVLKSEATISSYKGPNLLVYLVVGDTNLLSLNVGSVGQYLDYRPLELLLLFLIYGADSVRYFCLTRDSVSTLYHSALAHER